MKWLVFSDSHGNIEEMKKAIALEQPDRVLHLGDVARDCARLAGDYPELPFEQVRGNCDPLESPVPLEKELFFGSHRVWMLHGHTFYVKYSRLTLAEEARARGVDVVLFGHTHIPLCEREGWMWVMNPGTVSGRPRATYGVIEERDGELFCRTEEI